MKAKKVLEAKHAFAKEHPRAQATIELLMILAVSVVALGIIYLLYMDQVTSGALLRDASSARNTVQEIANSANSLYFSGVGSQAKILVDVPGRVSVMDSNISGKAILLKMKNGSDIVALTDVNVVGKWKPDSGRYYMYLYFDGNVVRISYLAFELSKESIAVSGTQGSIKSDYFTIRNNSDSNIEFWITNNFSHAPAVSLNLSAGYNHFILTSKEIKRIDMNFVLDASYSGNYPGTLGLVAFDGDTNVSKTIVVSAESLAG